MPCLETVFLRKGLNYKLYNNFNARFYMPDPGLFANADLLAERAPDLTPYRFGFNNPINFNDPSGLWEGDDDYGGGEVHQLPVFPVLAFPNLGIRFIGIEKAKKVLFCYLVPNDRSITGILIFD